MSINKVILVGNVGKDPETRYLDEGTAISKFPLATSETYKNRDGERITNTEWHNVVLWRGLAQVAEKYVRKGTQLYIEGRIKTRSYDDSDGNRKYITEIVGDQMQLLGRKPDDSGDQGQNESRESGGNSQGSARQTGGTPQSSQEQGGSPQPSREQGGTPQPSREQGGSPQPSREQGGPRGGGQPGSEMSDDEPDPFGSEDDGPDDLPF